MRTITTFILFMFIGVQFGLAQGQATQTQEKTFSWNETTIISGIFLKAKGLL